MLFRAHISLYFFAQALGQDVSEKANVYAHSFLVYVYENKIAIKKRNFFIPQLHLMPTLRDPRLQIALPIHTEKAE